MNKTKTKPVLTKKLNHNTCTIGYKFEISKAVNDSDGAKHIVLLGLQLCLLGLMALKCSSISVSQYSTCVILLDNPPPGTVATSYIFQSIGISTEVKEKDDYINLCGFEVLLQGELECWHFHLGNKRSKINENGIEPPSNEMITRLLYE